MPDPTGIQTRSMYSRTVRSDENSPIAATFATTRAFHADGEFNDRFCFFGRFALGAVTAEQSDRLRPQAQVGHHRDAHVR